MAFQDWQELNEYLHGKIGYCSLTGTSFPQATSEDLNEAHVAATDFMNEYPDDENLLLVQVWLNNIEAHPCYLPNDNNTHDAHLTQESIIPEESASSVKVSIVGGISQIETEIVDLYVDTKKCWARPAYTTVSVAEKGLEILKWNCKKCSATFAISKGTTANIQKHLKTQHVVLYEALMTKRNSGGSVLSQAPTQTHLNKKAKSYHFTQKGLTEWLVKYSVLTDQSFLSIEHPVFVGLLEYCHPGIVLPKRKRIKEDVLSFYKIKKENLKLRLKEVNTSLINDLLFVLYYRPLDIQVYEIIYGCYLSLHRQRLSMCKWSLRFCAYQRQTFWRKTSFESHTCI